MDHHIVNEPLSKIREIARNAARGNWWKLFLGLLISWLIIAAAIIALGLISYNLPIYRYLIIGDEFILINVTEWIIAPVLWVTIAPLTLGQMSFFIMMTRTRKVSYSLLFRGFTLFPKSVGLYFFMLIRIMAWSMLLIVPGIIAALRYSMSMYILADHPDWKVTECINESKRLMTGNKGKFFCLLLSFAGWYVIYVLTMTIIFFIAAVIIVTSNIHFLYMTFYMAIIMICLIPVGFVLIIPLTSYVSMAQTVFYELATGRIKVVDTIEGKTSPSSDGAGSAAAYSDERYEIEALKKEIESLRSQIDDKREF